MEHIRFEGIVACPQIAHFVPSEHYKVQLEPVSIVHVSYGFLQSIKGLEERDLEAADICMETLLQKFPGQYLYSGLRLGEYPTRLGHTYEILKGQPNGEPELDYAKRWTKQRQGASAPLLTDRISTSFLYADAAGRPHIARLYYFDLERTKASPELYSATWPRSGWVIAECSTGSRDWAYAGERIGHYNI